VPPVTPVVPPPRLKGLEMTAGHIQATAATRSKAKSGLSWYVAS
jgi:hypothetical protein